MASFCMVATLYGLMKRFVMAAHYGLDRLCNEEDGGFRSVRRKALEKLKRKKSWVLVRLFFWCGIVVFARELIKIFRCVEAQQ
jgi:hypothetical protein